jgi:CRP-like cAMP-binding protein
MVYRVNVGHISRFLQEVDIFKGLSERHLDRIAALCEETSFREGDVFGNQDERGSDLYIIKKGEIIVSTGSGDSSVVVRTVSEREAFPVAVLCEPPLLVTTTRATTDGETMVIPRVRLLELCELEPRIGMHVYMAGCAIIMKRYRYTLQMLSDSINLAAHINPSWEGAEV